MDFCLKLPIFERAGGWSSRPPVARFTSLEMKACDGGSTSSGSGPPKHIGVDLPLGAWHDTLLLHHCVYGALPQTLAFVASVYTRLPYWRDMVKLQSPTRRARVAGDNNRVPMEVANEALARGVRCAVGGRDR
jgi:uncharacterized protein YceK